MSATSVRALVAARVETLASVRHVYSADATSSVSGWPAEYVDDGPHALVTRGRTDRFYGTGNQWVMRAIDVEFRFSELASSEAQQTIDLLEDEIVTTFSAGITAGGAVIDLLYTGSEAPYLQLDDNERPWWVWVAHFVARERYAIEMTA